MITADFVNSLFQEFEKQRQPEEEKSLLEKMGLGIFTPEAYYKKMKGMVDIVSDYGKRAIETKLREDEEFMKDYVTAYTPTLPTIERQRAGQRLKKRYYNTVENMYMAQAVGRLGKLIIGKAKEVITGAKRGMFKRVFSRKEVLDSVEELQSYYVSVEGRTSSDALTRAWKTHTDVLDWAGGKYTLKGKAEVWVKRIPKLYEEIPAKVTPIPKPGLPAEVTRKPVDLQRLLAEGRKPVSPVPVAKPIISEKAVTKPEPTVSPKPKPLTPEEIEIIKHPPGRTIKEPPVFPETPTPVPPAPGIEKVITPYVPKKPVVKPTPLVPEEPVTEYAGTAFGERATPPIIGGVGLGEKSPLDVYYPGIGPPSGQLPAKPEFEMTKMGAEKLRGYSARELTNYPDEPTLLAKRGKSEAILYRYGTGDIEIAEQNIKYARTSWEKNYGGKRLNPQMEKDIIDAENTIKKIKEDLPVDIPELPERVITDVKVAQGKILPRPKKIHRFDVIKETTEDKIQTLRQRYTAMGQMTDEAYNKILEKEGLYNALTKQYREPKYIDAKNYITEDKGRAILRRIHKEAPVIKITESFNKAVRAKPDISKEVFNIDKRIKGGVKPGKQHRDPYSLESMRYYVQQAGRVMGNEAYAVYQDLVNSKAELAIQHEVLRGKLKASTPDFNKIANDDKALQRVSEYIASQSNLKGKPAMPKDITEGEVALAKELQRQFKDKQLQVRLAKFMQWYFTESRRVIPDFSEYADEIELARDIYDWRGYDELVKYLKTQEWGVVKSGYEPLESVVGPQVRVYTPSATAAATGHIQQRLDIRYHKSERNILQRYNSYMRQLDYLSVMQPKIKSLMNMFNDNIAKFKNPRKVRDDMTMFLAELKGYGGQPGFIDKALSRLYSQAMKTIIMPSPVLSFRNIMGQNISFAPDKSILFDPRNKKLTPDEFKYVETYVLQTKQMIDDYFLGKQKPLPGLGTLTKMLDKVRLYPLSDIANRYWGFWAKINQLKRVWKMDIPLSAKMSKTKFEDMTYPEQKMALQILAKDGQEEMFKYVSRVYTDNIHFIYERAQRSPAEMGALGKVVGNLALFPRAYWERMTKAGTMLSGKGRSFKTRYRGLKIIFATILGGEAMGEVYKRVTGRKRNPYSPLQLLQFRPGGLAWATIEEIATVWTDVVRAFGGDRNAISHLTIAIPKLPTMFVPFYSYMIRGLESLAGMKNIDRYALRKLRMLIDKEYKVRGGHYKVNRTAIEKWQYFFSGRGIRIEEEEKPKRKTGRYATPEDIKNW